MDRRIFTSFTDDSENKDPVRRVTNIKIVSNGEKLRITYYGTGFMYHMVRIMTGTLLEVGTGEREASMIPVVIAAEDRSLAGFLAPARGLFLRKVVLLMPLLLILKNWKDKNRRQEHRRLK